MVSNVSSTFRARRIVLRSCVADEIVRFQRNSCRKVTRARKMLGHIAVATECISASFSNRATSE